MKVFVYTDKDGIKVLVENEFDIYTIEKMRFLKKTNYFFTSSNSWQDITTVMAIKKDTSFSIMLDIPKNSSIPYEIKKRVPEIFL